MKKSTVGLLAGLALTALGLAAWRMTHPSAAAPAAQTSSTAQLELGPDDVITVHPQTLSLGLPVSGTLRATQTALIKARVAGELMDLSVREGDGVRSGQVLARIDPSEYQARWQQARQQADSARAQMDIAQKQYDNNAALVEQGFISRTALQTSQWSLQGAQAAWQSAMAAAEVARKALDDATLKSPISGQISQRLAQPGERLVVDARILEVVNLDRFELEAALPPDEAANVRPGLVAQLQVEGAPQPVTATVLRINPSAQAGSRSVLVYLGVAANPGLRHGAFAQGTLATHKQEGLAVPLGSVRTDKPQPYVQVIDQGAVRHVTVQTGARQQQATGTLVLVTGVPEGSQVLAPTVGSVREGIAVAMTSKPR